MTGLPIYGDLMLALLSALTMWAMLCVVLSICVSSITALGMEKMYTRLYVVLGLDCLFISGLAGAFTGVFG